MAQWDHKKFHGANLFEILTGYVLQIQKYCYTVVQVLFCFCTSTVLLVNRAIVFVDVRRSTVADPGFPRVKRLIFSSRIICAIFITFLI